MPNFWEIPLVVDVADVPAERHGVWDLYAPAADEPSPAVVFVHGGPLPPGLPVPPREWTTYRGYGALAAAAGLVGITVDHPLYGLTDYPAAHAVVEQAVEAARADARVDADRVALWVFSGGGPLITPWLARPPAWLRVLAATYPYLDSIPDFPLADGFRPSDALGAASPPPFVLTRVGLERPPVAAGVERFLTAAEQRGLRVTVVDVPHGQHGFDTIDPGPESADAVRSAVGLVAAAVRS